MKKTLAKRLSQRAPKRRSCKGCGRFYQTGLKFVRPFCPTCWIDRENAKRPELTMPPWFQPQTQMEHLVEDWCAYSGLIGSTVEYYGRGTCRKHSFAELTPQEQKVYTLSQFDALVREQNFSAYFRDFAHQQHFIEPGLKELEAHEHLELFRGAWAIYKMLPEAERERLAFFDENEPTSCLHVEYGTGLEEFSSRYFHSEDLLEQLAIQALEAGLIVERDRRRKVGS